MSAIVMPVTFTHANNGSEIIVYPEMVFAVVTLPEHKCVALMSVGGAMVPITGTLAEANKKLLEVKRPPSGDVQPKKKKKKRN
jgi:hypothetical protein